MYIYRIRLFYTLIALYAPYGTAVQQQRNHTSPFHIMTVFRQAKDAAAQQLHRYTTPLLLEATGFLVGGTTAYLIGRNDSVQHTMQTHSSITHAACATMIGTSMLVARYTFDTINDRRNTQTPQTAQPRHTTGIYAGSSASGLLCGLVLGNYITLSR